MRIRSATWVLAAACLAAWAGGAEDTPDPRPASVGGAAGKKPVPGDHDRSITHRGLERTYRVHVPRSAGGAGPMPLVIALHGGGGTGRKMQDLTLGGLNRLADREGFVVVYPDGIERHWNDGRKKVRYRTHREKIDDVGFISALIDHLAGELDIDTGSVYATGMSNGAMMSHRLACDLADRIAAIAPVTGCLPAALSDAKPSRPVPVLIINGTEDSMMPWEGGEIGFGRLKFGEVLSARDTVGFWVARNGCRLEPVVTREPDRDPADGTRIRREVHAAGKGGAEVILCAVEGGGHTWPGGRQYLSERLIGRTSKDIDASRVIWEFFKKHSLPAGASGSAAPPRPDRRRAHFHRPGPHRVATMEFPDLRDAGRDGRPVPIKVLYPDADGPFPLAVMSHGGMGTWDAHLFHAQHLASHGYVVLCVEHVYSNNVKAKEHMRRATGTFKEKLNEALQRITTDPKAVLERPGDVSFAIDRAILWNRTRPELKGKINTDRIAVIGHSFGAYTVLAVCGARPILDYLKPAVKPGKGLARDLSDPRVTVGVAMSPQGPGTSRFGKDSYRTINRPLLCLSGSKDAQFGHDGSEQPAEKRLEGFGLMPPGERHMLWLENADHLCFSDNPKAWMLPSKARPDAQRITKAMTLVFCDVFLKGRKEAAKHLAESYASSLCGKVVTKVKWLRK